MRTEKPLALVMFAFAFFSLSALVAEFWRGATAQRALSGGGYASALGRVVGRNRRRYGGYVVHAGIAILLIAVAASSSFQTSEDARLLPGDSTEVGDYTLTYERPTVDHEPAEERITFGALLAVERDGESFATLHPSRNYYAAEHLGRLRGAAAELLRGRGDERGRPPRGPRRRPVDGDAPDLEPLDEVDQRRRREARGAGAGCRAGRADAGAARGDAGGFRRSRVRRSCGSAPCMRRTRLPVDFRVNVNPFVLWLWIGGGIAVAGALVAGWPSPEARRRRVSDVYAARLARDLGRA